MAQREIVKNTHFEEIDEVRVDSKNRITLRKGKGISSALIYKIYRNDLGQLVLDPQVTIPAYEQWLFKNETARNLVRKGLEDAKENRLVDADEDYSQFADED